ncbi:Mitotic spindle checkpoint component mad3 [Fusarium oxysporum f. sp. albedinis]|nr:Mitotic spindle checkpoint component mad3 [Fusarium oxysporum f. sp. albedinis]
MLQCNNPARSPPPRPRRTTRKLSALIQASIHLIYLISLGWRAATLELPGPAAMALSTTIPPAAPDSLDLGIHTPANLNRGARAALLQNSPAAVNGTIGVSPGPRRMAQTPSSPLNAATTAAATEGAERASPHRLLNSNQSLSSNQPMISRANA